MSTGRPIPNLLSSILATITDFVSSPSSSESTNLSRFAFMVERLSPALHSLQEHQNHEISGSSSADDLRKALDSLDTRFKRLRIVIGNAGLFPPARLIEGSAREIGRCVGAVMSACGDAPEEVRERVAKVEKEMLEARFEDGASGVFGTDLEDVVLRVKNGGEGDELRVALEDLEVMVRDGLVGENGGVLVLVLLNRLRSVKDGNRLVIILLLRRLAMQTVENKEMMADIGALSTFVRSLSRDCDESRAAVGLLLDLSEIPKVRQRIGRIQGCIVMLVILFNGSDHCASNDAGKLLHAISSNIQNVLLMSEAGYFAPMVHYLKEGSDMIKILMATSLSRMKLSDEMKATLAKEGSFKPLVDMFTNGKLEAKLSSLGALENLSTLMENVEILINAGIVSPLLEVLFSVTSVFMTLREPAAAILACVAKSDLILNVKEVPQQILSLISLSRPAIRCHLLNALNSIASHRRASKVRYKMKKKGALQLILPFLVEDDDDIRRAALNLLYTLSKGMEGKSTDYIGEAHLSVLVNMLSTSVSEDEKATAAGIISNLPVNDKKVTEILQGLNLLPLLISSLSVCITASSSIRTMLLLDNIASVVVRFTVPWDKKLQKASVDLGVIPLLVKLLSSGSPITQSRAATSLGNLSQNSISLCKSKTSTWSCIPSSSEALCEVHNCKCTVKGTYCLVKACCIVPLLQILKGKEREADEAVLNALATLLHDDLWENGSDAIDKASGVEPIIGILEVGNFKAQEKALWILERIFRIERYREKYGKIAQVVLIGLAQKGEPTLRPIVAKILAHLEFLQEQSSYF